MHSSGNYVRSAAVYFPDFSLPNAYTAAIRIRTISKQCRKVSTNFLIQSEDDERWVHSLECTTPGHGLNTFDLVRSSQHSGSKANGSDSSFSFNRPSISACQFAELYYINLTIFCSVAVQPLLLPINTMWGWFGGAAAQKRRDAPKNAILMLRQQLDMLQKRERHLESQMAEQDAIARKNVATNKTGKFLPPCQLNNQGRPIDHLYLTVDGAWKLLRIMTHNSHSCESCPAEEEAAREQPEPDNSAACTNRAADLQYRSSKY